MLQIDKQSCRKASLTKRGLIPPKDIREGSELICTKLFSAYNLEGKMLSLFLPIEHKNEIDTYLILEKALSIDSSVAIPKANFETLDLVHKLYEGPTQLEMSSYGIPEPKHGKVINPSLFDYVIVPLLCFDKRGYRVGYGKGFYDRFLKKCGPKTQFVGLSLLDPVEELLDVDQYDILMHACVTPRDVFRF